MKLLRPFTGTGAIFFPIGLPPKGTCEFASKECLKSCYAYSDSLFDYEPLPLPEGKHLGLKPGECKKAILIIED